jgi:hypothetical protein
VEAIVSERIERDFDRLYYVRRPEDEISVITRTSLGRVLAVTGARGSGKTTLLRRICLRPDLVEGAERIVRPDIRLDPGDDGNISFEYVYLDMLDFRSIAASTEQYSPETILAWLLQRLIDKLVTPARESGSLWTLAKIQKSDAFFAFRERMNLIMSITDESDILRAARNKGLRYDWEAASQRFLSPEYILDSFGEFLEFLEADLSHRVVIVIDSLDHLLPGTQESLSVALSKVVNVAHSRSAAVMAIREEAFPRLEQALEPWGGIDGLNIDTNSLRPTSADLVRDFLRSRLNAVLAAKEDVRASIAGATPETLASFDELLASNSSLVRVFASHALRGTGRAGMIDHLGKYCNGSLRQAAHIVQRMIYDAVTDVHPLSPYAETSRALVQAPATTKPDGLWEEQNRTLVRVHMFRKFFFAGKRPERVPIAFPLIRMRRYPNGSRVVFPKLRMLDFLVSSDRETATLSEIREAFASLGLDPRNTDRAARELITRREAGDSGLVWTGRPIEEGMSDASAKGTVLALESSGRYIRESFARSADYLFWAASCNTTTWPLFTDAAKRVGYVLGENADESSVPYNVLLDCGFRVVVAALYLTERILPRYYEEVPVRVRNEDGYKKASKHAATMMDLFGPDLYPQHAANRVSGFANNLHQEGRISVEVDRLVLNLVRPCEEYCVAVDQMANLK